MDAEQNKVVRPASSFTRVEISSRLCDDDDVYFYIVERLKLEGETCILSI